MKTVDPALATLINSLPSGGSFQYAHLYTFSFPFTQGGSQVLFGKAIADPSIMAAWQVHENLTPIVVSKRSTPGALPPPADATVVPASGRPVITLRRSSDERGAGGAIRRANATLAGSTQGQNAIYLTDAPIDVSWQGITYSSRTVLVNPRGSPMLAHWKRGLDVDSTTVTLMPRLSDPITGAAYPDKIGSVPFIEAARGGALDGADVQIDRAFFYAWQWGDSIQATGNDSYTHILLHFDGASGSTTFTDSSIGGSSRTWTPAGTAQIDTTQYKFGGASGLFDGAGGYITAPHSQSFTLGSSDWTVDCWFNCGAAAGIFSFLGGQVDVAVTPALSSVEIGRSSANVMFLTAYVGGATFTLSGTTQVTNVTNPGWHHLAAVRTGNILKLFLDGVQEGGNLAIAGSINDSAETFGVASLGGFTADPWNGWIDEFRLSVGIARWTANFTPPTSAYAAGRTGFSPITPAGTILIFAGTPVEVDTTDTTVVVNVNDYRQLLQNKFPRVHFQLQCHHTLYDVGCTLSAASFSVNGVCGSGSSRQSIVANADIVAPTNPGSGTFTLGRLTFTSGLNSGFSRTVRLWTSPRTFALLNPVPFTVSAGDTFSVAAGCDKSQSTCTAFNNLVSFGGEPFIPDATVAV